MVVSTEQALIEAWNLALAQEKVIYGALKKERVWQQNVYWHDFVHEGMLVYVRTYLDYVQKVAVFELKPFNRYAYQAIRWHIRNLLRRDQWLQSHTKFCLDAPLVPELTDERGNMAQGQVTLSDAVERCVTSLSKRQQVILKQHLLLGVPLTQLAQSLQVSARTLRSDRQQVLAKLRSLLV